MAVSSFVLAGCPIGVPVAITPLGDGSVGTVDGGPTLDGSRPGGDSGTMTSADGPTTTGDAGTVIAPDGATVTGDVWDGYIEAYTFPSGSDHVRIVFDAATGDGPRTGTVVFGMGTAPPPATDPTMGYPPGFNPEGVGGGGMLPIAEGFAYPIVSGSVTGTRVQASVDVGSLWAGWCSLQTSIPQDTSGENYGCLPNSGSTEGSSGCSYGDPSTGAPVPVDCSRLYLCETGHVCACDATGCRVGSVGAITFDFHVTGNAGDGTVAVEGAMHNVHLTD